MEIIQMTELFDKALAEAKSIKKSITDARIDEVAQRLSPSLERAFQKALNEDDAFPSGFGTDTLDKRLGTKRPDSYDDLSELGDGEAIFESGVEDEEEIETEPVAEGAHAEPDGDEAPAPAPVSDDEDLDEEIFEDDDEFNIDDELAEMADEFNEGEEDVIDLDTVDEAEEVSADDEFNFEDDEDEEAPAPAPVKKESSMALKYESALKENIKLKRELYTAKKRLTESQNETASIKTGAKKLVKAISLYKSAINESELKYNKLYLANKLFSTKKLEEKVRTAFVNYMEKATTLNEANAVYNKFRKYGKVKNNVSKLQESVKSSTTVSNSQPDVDTARWSRLAGINQDK